MGVGDDADPLLRDALTTAAANLASFATGPIITDDRAPTEYISDSSVIRYLLGAGPSGLGTLGQ